MNFSLVVEALRAELEALRAPASRHGMTLAEAWNVLVVVALRSVLRELAQGRGRRAELLAQGRLFTTVPGFELDDRAAQRVDLAREIALVGLPGPVPGWHEQPTEAFGQLYESLLALRPSDQHSLRKRTGSYYTPLALTRVVVERAFDALDESVARDVQQPLRVLDPACGAAAFLMQAGREVAHRTHRSLREVVRHELFGVDVSPLALAVAEASLWLLADDDGLSLREAGQHLREGDALCSPNVASALGRRGVDFVELAGDEAGFDLVLGNPPWVAFAGRATQPLPRPLREHYRRSFQAFRGYPTLHALFVELAARLAPRGVVSLLVPSPLADLDGYRPVRSALAASHTACEPLLELGQDAFEGVTQPCFALIAAPGAQATREPGAPLVLSERRRALGAADRVRAPAALARLDDGPRLPSELFGEMGLQTNSAVSRQLLYRGQEPPREYSYALLEGRNVAEFTLGSPKLFLKPDRALLEALRCRLRDAADYARVKVVVRQTAAILIAAPHDGTPFRNSLLAGFETSEFPALLTIGLLNSTLYRALHLAGRRDARQGAFPQVKVAHLRSLPAPPEGAARGEIVALAARACRSGLDAELRLALDAAVFGLFGVPESDLAEIASFVRRLAPAAGLRAPLA